MISSGVVSVVAVNRSASELPSLVKSFGNIAIVSETLSAPLVPIAVLISAAKSPVIASLNIILKVVRSPELLKFCILNSV